MSAATGRKVGTKGSYGFAPGAEPYILRLYVAGSSLKSTQAIQIVRKLCSSYPPVRFKLEVIDLFQQPDRARRDNIVAVPSVVKVHPPPRRAFIGITEDTTRILHKLGIPIVDYGKSKSKKS